MPPRITFFSQKCAFFELTEDAVFTKILQIYKIREVRETLGGLWTYYARRSAITELFAFRARSQKSF